MYGAVYDSELKAVRDEVVMKLPAWLESLPEGDLEFITTGFPLPSALVRAPIVEAPRALAGAIGRIAATRFSEGLAEDPLEIDANYVRRSDAELLWKD